MPVCGSGCCIRHRGWLGGEPELLLFPAETESGGSKEPWPRQCDHRIRRVEDRFRHSRLARRTLLLLLPRPGPFPANRAGTGTGTDCPVRYGDEAWNRCPRPGGVLPAYASAFPDSGRIQTEPPPLSRLYFVNNALIANTNPVLWESGHAQEYLGEFQHPVP